MLFEMKRKWYVALTIVLLSIFVFAMGTFVITRASAKRGPRPVVSPIEIAGIEYRAPNTAETEGVIEAWDIKSHTLLWRKKVYHTLWIPFLEEDNQWVFIKNMTVGSSGSKLIIVNEAGRRYVVKVNPPMRPITKVVIWSSALSAVAILVFLYRKIRKRQDLSINQ
jgi:hypothetical protein